MATAVAFSKSPIYSYGASFSRDRTYNQNSLQLFVRESPKTTHTTSESRLSYTNLITPKDMHPHLTHMHKKLLHFVFSATLFSMYILFTMMREVRSQIQGCLDGVFPNGNCKFSQRYLLSKGKCLPPPPPTLPRLYG